MSPLDMIAWSSALFSLFIALLFGAWAIREIISLFKKEK